MRKICVVGLGYVGLPTLLMLANYKKKCEFYGYDTDKNKINFLNSDKIYINEEKIKQLYFKNKNKIKFLNTLPSSDCYIICVPTPLKKNRADISFVKKASIEVSNKLKKNNTIIFESTVPVGTTEKIIKEIKKKRPDLKLSNDYYQKSDINVAYCPERVLPGNIFNELLNNDRIVGGLNKSSINAAKKIFLSYVKGNLYGTNIKTAEISKLAENSYRDVNIGFANELDKFCEKMGVNSKEVFELCNKHPRVNILNSGIGVGGHCIAIDPKFVLQTEKNFKLIKYARVINDNRPNYFIKKIKNILKDHKNNKIKNISFFGLSYKPDVNDFRESPAIKILKGLNFITKYNKFYVEPNINYKIKEIEKLNFKKISIEKSIEISDLIFILVGHKIFKKIKRKIKKVKIYDFSGKF